MGDMGGGGGGGVQGRGRICITNKLLYFLPGVSALCKFVITTGLETGAPKEASPALLPPPFKCHRVSTWDGTTIINTRTPPLSLRDNELATFFSGAIKMQMAPDV